MLIITRTSPLGKPYDCIWHTGCKLPKMGRVVTMQADGDELEIILHALRQHEGTKDDPQY